MPSNSGNTPAPADTQPVPARRQGDAAPEPGAPSPSQKAECLPQVSELPARRLLFLDDDPQRAIVFLNRHPETVWVLTAEECIARLAEEWDQVHLDHDLGGEVYVDPLRYDCGMEVVRWLCASVQDQLRETWFIVHSHNFEAASDMVKHLCESGYHAVYQPFGVELLDRLQDSRPQLPAPAPTPRLPSPSEGLKEPCASGSPSIGTKPVERLSVFFKLLRRLIARRPAPSGGVPSDRQLGKNEPVQTASREAGSRT